MQVQKKQNVVDISRHKSKLETMVYELEKVTKNNKNKQCTTYRNKVPQTLIQTYQPFNNAM